MNTPRRSARIAAKMGNTRTQSVTTPVIASVPVTVPVTLRRSARIAAKRMTVTVQSKHSQSVSNVKAVYQKVKDHPMAESIGKIRNFLNMIHSTCDVPVKVVFITNMLRYMCTEDVQKLLLIKPILRNAVKDKLVELPKQLWPHQIIYGTAIDFTDSVTCLKKCIEEIEKSPACVF